MSKGKKLLDDRLPTTMISKQRLAEIREAAYLNRVSVGKFVRDSLDERLQNLKQAA